MQKPLFAFLIFAIYISGCQKQAARQQDTCITSSQIPPSGYPLLMDSYEVTYNGSHCGYLPLGKNNYWVYLDSVFNSAGQFLHTLLDTIRFTKTYRTPDGIIWWSVSNTNGLVLTGGYPKYNYSTDSISYGTSVPGNRGIKWFYSINAPSQTENIMYSDVDSPCYAEKLLNPVTSPAGTFTGCIYFNKKLIYGTGVELSTWYKPRIGVIKTQMYLSSVRIRSAILLSYHIE